MANLKTPVISLGAAQTDLEAASKELSAAQANFLRAQERLTTAEESHNTALVNLMSEVNTVRNKCKVVPLALR